MSPGPDQRAFRWGEWFGAHNVPSYTLLALTGFVHQCGAANVIEAGEWEYSAHQIVCSGCRSEIQRPMDECEPLWRRKSDG